MDLKSFFSLHPALLINVLIATLLGIALVATGDPLVLLGLAFMLFHSSQQIMTQGSSTEAGGEAFDDDEPSIGFTARLR